MKREFLNQLCMMLSGIIGMLAGTAFIGFIGARANKSIDVKTFFIGVAVSIVVMALDVRYINKHFVDGEWV